MNSTYNIVRSIMHRLAGIWALMATAAIASAGVIDDFSQGALSIQVTNLTGQTILQNGLSASSVIGGSRSLYTGSLGLGTASIDTSAGQFHFSADSSYGYFTLQYGMTAPLAANLEADGSDTFLMNISQLTPGLRVGGFDFQVESANTRFTYDFSHDLFALNGPGALAIPFSRFAGADMTDVQAIEVSVIRFEPTYQIALDSITTVPEPSPLTFLVIELLLPILALALKRSLNHDRRLQGARSCLPDRLSYGIKGGAV